MAQQEDIRLLALEVLVEVEKKNIYVKDALHRTLFQKQFLAKQERAFLTRLVEGVTEYQVRLDYVINEYSKVPVHKCKPLIRCVLRMGVYQMLYMDSVPVEAACNECVRLTKKKGFYRLSGYVNGVLRSIARDKDSISYPDREQNPTLALSVSYSMPEWIVKELLLWYGVEKTQAILEATLQTGDLTVRVNTQKTTVAAFTERLKEKGICVKPGMYVKEALHLETVNSVNRIPGYTGGEFFVQDESSMLLYTAALPEVERQQQEPLQILDLCAAPGGKCTHFAQMLGDRALIEARDVTRKKVRLIEENKERLSLDRIRTVVWDALVPDPKRKEWADIVIADLPCSGFGIMSKKNDIKYRIRKEQLLELENLQRTILANAAEYVKPGGILLYSTCTINPSENCENAKWFTGHFPFEQESLEAVLPENLRPFLQDKGMLQLLPGEAGCDGFFIAKFKKEANKGL